MTWRIAVRHRTGYHYGTPARASYNEVRMTPATAGDQHTLTSRLETRAGGAAAALRRLLGHGRARLRRARAAHRAGRDRVVGGGDARPPAGAAGDRLGRRWPTRPSGTASPSCWRRPGTWSPSPRWTRSPLELHGAHPPAEAGPAGGRLGARHARLRPRGDRGGHHLGRGAGRRQGGLPGLLAPRAGGAAVGRAAGPVRLRLPAPAPRRGPRRAGAGREPRVGGVLGRRLGAAATRPTCPRSPSGTCSSPAAGTTRTSARWPGSTPGRPPRRSASRWSSPACAEPPRPAHLRDRVSHVDPVGWYPTDRCRPVSDGPTASAGSVPVPRLVTADAPAAGGGHQ